MILKKTMDALWYQEHGAVAERFGQLDITSWVYCFAPIRDGAFKAGKLKNAGIISQWRGYLKIPKSGLARSAGVPPNGAA